MELKAVVYSLLLKTDTPTALIVPLVRIEATDCIAPKRFSSVVPTRKSSRIGSRNRQLLSLLLMLSII